jgi:hypothetical protein
MATSPNWMGVCAEFVVLHIAVLVTLPTIIARASYNAGDLFTGSSAIGACMMHLSSAALYWHSRYCCTWLGHMGGNCITGKSLEVEVILSRLGMCKPCSWAV